MRINLASIFQHNTLLQHITSITIPFPSSGPHTENAEKFLLDESKVDLHLQDEDAKEDQHDHHRNQHDEILYGIDVSQTKLLENSWSRLPEALKHGVTLT